MTPLRRKRLFRTAAITAAILAAAYLALAVPMAIIEPEAHISPRYPTVDISPILKKEVLTDSDYRILFYQTGLAEPAITELRKLYPDSADRILRFQKNFFSEVRIICEKNSLVSREESLVDENGRLISGTELAPLHNGYILVTKSSHTYGWRNGHSALVVDALNGVTLESVVVGTNSAMQDINKWTNYPNFMLYRIKNASQDLLDEISTTAAGLLTDIPYRLSVGIFSPKSAERDKITGTHCSHLIWQAFHFYGYDLDSDRGMLVTPKDIANSPELEIVQVYGVDPGNIWP